MCDLVQRYITIDVERSHSPDAHIRSTCPPHAQKRANLTTLHTPRCVYRQGLFSR